jgi:hypothetical protein
MDIVIIGSTVVVLLLLVPSFDLLIDGYVVVVDLYQ